MVDMHLHTFYSDGTLSPWELVRRAAERGVTTIAITDHDGISGIPEALEAGKQFGVTVVPGIEFSTGMAEEELAGLDTDTGKKNIFLHILGHGIDTENQELVVAVERIRRQREERNLKLLAVLNQIGYRIDPKDLDQHGGKGYVGKPNFAIAMLKRGHIKTLKEAFAPGQFLHHPEVRKIHRDKIHVRDAISLIRKAKGQAVLAHPLKIGFLRSDNEDIYQRLEVLLDCLQQWGLTGMECHYSTHTPQQAIKLVEIAKRRGLLATSGSDFHGPEFNPSIDVGVVVDLSSE
jgi:predicted metal-dependent phosphoesterase TrpH